MLVTLGGMIALGVLGFLMAGNASAQDNPDANQGQVSTDGGTAAGGLLGSLTSPLTDTVQHVTAPVTSAVGTAVAPVANTVDAVTGPVTRTVATVAAPLVRAVATPVAGVLAPVTHAVAPVLAPVTAVVPQRIVSSAPTNVTTQAAPVAATVPAAQPAVITAPGTSVDRHAMSAASGKSLSHQEVVALANSQGGAMTYPGGVPVAPWLPDGQAFGSAAGTTSASSGGSSGTGSAVSGSRAVLADSGAQWARPVDPSTAHQRWCPYDHNHPS